MPGGPGLQGLPREAEQGPGPPARPRRVRSGPPACLAPPPHAPPPPPQEVKAGLMEAGERGHSALCRKPGSAAWGCVTLGRPTGGALAQ